MSYRLRRKSRAQADVEIYGGPLNQKRFDGGMNIDSPASEIKENQVAYAENVIFRESGMEARPGCVKYSANTFGALTPTSIYGYSYSPVSYSGSYQNFRHTLNYGGAIRSYPDNPGGAYLDSTYLSGLGSIGTWDAGTGDTTMIPFRRGWLTFTSSKISYTDPLGSFQVNSPNPVHGVKDDNASGTFKYRYLMTLSRILVYNPDPTGATIAADRFTTGAEVVHESGTNGNRYLNGATSTARDRDYGEVLTANAIDSTHAYTVANANLVGALCSTSSTITTAAARHFTHVSIYRCMDYGSDGIAAGNNKALYVWLADVKRTDVDAGATLSDTFSDDVLQNRANSKNLLLKTQGLTPMPSGSCAEMAGGWLFVADRTNSNPENYLNYCGLSSPENIGYFIPDIQRYRYNDGIRALKANQDILSVFCNNSSHIVNLTAINNDASSIQYVPFLTYFHTVDRSLGIKDWATLDSIDQNSMIAVCSDGSVRVWDTTKWGDDLAFDRVSSEIKQIVPASPYNYAQGSVGKFYNGAYYLWYATASSYLSTTKCLRYGFGTQTSLGSQSAFGNQAALGRQSGFGRQAGFGWSFYTGWVYPPFKCGVQVIVDNLGIQRLIVLNATTGTFFWVETFRPFTGAYDAWDQIGAGTYSQLDRFDTDKGTYGAAGTEITSTWKYRELTGTSEEDFLIHDETFIRWRPFSEASGYRSGTTVSLSAYTNGSTTASETVTNQPRSASIKFTREIGARRVQLGVSVNKGSWKTTGIDSHFRSLDRINYATSGDVSSTESTTSYPQYQAELANSPLVWVTRRQTGINRSTALNLSATGAVSLLTGPDGKGSSAHSFSSSYYTIPNLSMSSGPHSNATISFWVKNPTNGQDIFRMSGAGSNMYVQLSSGSTVFNFSGAATVSINANSGEQGGFTHFAIVNADGTYSLYQDSALKGTFTSPSTFGGTSLSLGFPVGNGAIFDFRMLNVAWSASAVAYYFNDVVNNNGTLVLPQV